MKTNKSLAAVIAALTMVFLCLSAQAQTYLTNGLVAYYPFNGNANDESGLGNDGIVHGAALTADRFGNATNAYSFNGLNQYISAPHQQYLNFPNGCDFTISVWVSFTDMDKVTQLVPASGAVFVGKDNGGGSHPKWFFAYSDTPTLNGKAVLFLTDNYSGGGQWIAPFLWQPLAGVWHQYLIRKSGTEYSVSVDGRIESTAQGPSSTPDGITSDLTIGQAENGDYLYGTLDDIRIYNRALSDQEVKDLYSYEAPEGPWLTLEVKTVQVTLHVKPTKKYQLQASLDLKTWTNMGDAFLATTSELAQEFNAIEVGRFFRLYEVP